MGLCLSFVNTDLVEGFVVSSVDVGPDFFEVSMISSSCIAMLAVMGLVRRVEFCFGVSFPGSRIPRST